MRPSLSGKPIVWLTAISVSNAVISAARSVGTKADANNSLLYILRSFRDFKSLASSTVPVLCSWDT